jgi:hypothetical protein
MHDESLKVLKSIFLFYHTFDEWSSKMTFNFNNDENTKKSIQDHEIAILTARWEKCLRNFYANSKEIIYLLI